MSVTSISLLNPRVWGVTLQFKVLKAEEVRVVNFKDGSEHRVGEFLVGDNTGVIVFSAWDESIEQFKISKCYEVTEARLTVFNNTMKLTMSRKSEVKEIEEDITPDSSNNLSEKRFEPPKKFTYKKNYKT